MPVREGRLAEVHTSGCDTHFYFICTARWCITVTVYSHPCIDTLYIYTPSTVEGSVWRVMVTDSLPRRHPISSTVYGANALVVKPANSLSPMLVVAILNHFGYEQLKVNVTDLTPSLPWCHFKTTNKSTKFETLNCFCLKFFLALACGKIFIKTRSIQSRCYRTGKYTVYRRDRASFSPEILQAGAEKGLNIHWLM